MNEIDIAKQIKNYEENIFLIYAFNGIGKTRLSVAYKNYTKSENNGKHSGVYYNAYSEDLFVWDNEYKNDKGDLNVKLNIIQSSLNRLHGSITEDSVKEKLIPYNPSFNFFFNPYKNPENGIESIYFYKEGDETTSIKISRGEERIFVWCLFLALFEVEGFADDRNAHFFIDDPVSSLDDHNIFITAATIFDLIEKHFETKKIIITSHHFGILSILSDWLSKGEKASKFTNRDKSKKFKEFILERDGEEFQLTKPTNGVFLYHLRLLQILDNANRTQIYAYHFALLRQVLENIASFLGVGHFSYVIEQIGITEKARVSDIVNALSHQKIYLFQSDLVVEDNAKLFKEIVERLLDRYKFILHTD